MRLCILMLIFLLVPLESTQAETASFKIQSDHKFKVQISFFSQNRSHEWPGGGRSYNLNDSEEHTFNLTCNKGEKICYGAWETGSSSPYWGSGPGNRQACTNCCVVCGHAAVKSARLYYTGESNVSEHGELEQGLGSDSTADAVDSFVRGATGIMSNQPRGGGYRPRAHAPQQPSAMSRGNAMRRDGTVVPCTPGAGSCAWR